jgi:hypothetical protein
MIKRPGFFEGVIIALAFSLLGGAVFTMFHPFVAAGFLTRLIVSALAFCYILYLLWRSQERTGRVTVVIAWLIASITIWVFSPSILLYVMLHLALIWLVRSLYFHAGIVPSLLDLGLTGIALLLALAAGLHTQSLFIGLWCFFLCQALFVYIPATLQRKARSTRQTRHEDRFERAHQVAVAAVRKLSSIS